MENRDLISKWLNNELTPRELEAFKQTEDYSQYKEIVENAARFQRPVFDEQQALQELKTRLASRNESKVKKLNFSTFYKIASVFVVLLATGLFFWLNRPQVISTGFSEMAALELPDQSKVKLNADSKIAYNPSNWNKQRTMELEGEAYFEVLKGETFSVASNHGKVTVLGTRFNIKDRADYFEVQCYEGVVKVNAANREVILRKGSSVRIMNGKFQKLDTFKHSAPGWTKMESEFSAVPLKQVIAELERQFNIKIEVREVDLNQLFTGSFGHDDKEIALKAVSIPLQLNYKFESEKKVILYVE